MTNDEIALIDEVVTDVMDAAKVQRATASAIVNRMFSPGISYTNLYRASLERVKAEKPATTLRTGLDDGPALPRKAQAASAPLAPAPAKATSRCQCAPDCDKEAMPGRSYAYGHAGPARRAKKTNVPAPAPEPKPPQLASDAPAEPPARVEAEPVSTLAANDFRQKYGRAKPFDAWRSSVIRQIEDMAVPWYGEIRVTDGSSVLGVRRTIEVHFRRKKPEYRVRLFTCKGDKLAIGISKESR